MTQFHPKLDRRQLLALAAIGSAGVGLPSLAQSTPMEANLVSASGKTTIAMLVHPDMFALDLIGPMTVFKMLDCDVRLVWKDKTPVSTDIDIPLTPTHTFGEVPETVDVLFVPGGLTGTMRCMEDPEVMAFLADRGSRAKWVTSVCTGSLALAAAGLLRGYDATSHWTVADLLPLMGARWVDKRVVVDRNRISGGGVTAGIDFGLGLAARLRDEETARRVQLILEYAPEPPFRNGTPAEAGAQRVADTLEAAPYRDEPRKAAEAARKRLGI